MGKEVILNAPLGGFSRICAYSVLPLSSADQFLLFRRAWAHIDTFAALERAEMMCLSGLLIVHVLAQ
jgi:hypothetical protein